MHRSNRSSQDGRFFCAHASRCGEGAWSRSQRCRPSVWRAAPKRSLSDLRSSRPHPRRAPKQAIPVAVKDLRRCTSIAHAGGNRTGATFGEVCSPGEIAVRSRCQAIASPTHFTQNLQSSRRIGSFVRTLRVYPARTEIAFGSMRSRYFGTWLSHSDERRLHIIMIRTQPPISPDGRCRSPFSDHPAGLSLSRLHTMPPPLPNRPPVGTLRAPPGLHGCPPLHTWGCWRCLPATPPRWYRAAS